MSGRAQGAWSAIADADRHKNKDHGIILTLVYVLLFQPSLHQFHFELLIRDDLLRESSHLRVLAVQELRLCHVDRCLMVRQHQPDEIDIAVARSRNGTHCHVHLVHTRNQLRPIGAGDRPTVVAITFYPNTRAERSNAKDQQ